MVVAAAGFDDVVKLPSAEPECEKSAGRRPPDKSGSLADDVETVRRRREEGDAAEAEPMFRETETVEQPIERDLTEAQQLLQLSQLEGRDPLQDAVVGRLAIDRLDALADSEQESEAERAAWAHELRTELKERFNEIAPTKFSVDVT